jgi:hypothetical protein
MAKRIFISFAIEDANLRTLLVGQARNNNSPFEFTDMSVKEAWDEKWKTQCRSRIRGCDGVIGIITKNTPSADGQLWELKCAYDENVPVFLVYGSDARPSLPALISGKRINVWTWDNIKSFMEKT